jgi:phage terminase small subunit
MGSRGPLPTPWSTETARGRNTFRADEPPEVDVAPPDWLAGPALEYWHATAPSLVTSGRLRACMATTFAVLCELAADCEALSHDVSAEGQVVNGRANPKTKLLRDARRDLLQYSKAFGLDTNSSARLPGPAVPEKKNALAAYIANGPERSAG